MKNKAIILLLFVFFSAGLFTIITEDRAYAAAAECYSRLSSGSGGRPGGRPGGGAGAVTRARCSVTFRHVVAEQFSRPVANALRDDKCYLLNQSSGVVIEANIDSPSCVDWRLTGGPVPAPPSRTPPGGSSIDNPDRAANINCGTQRECLRNNSLVQLFTVAIKFFTVIIGVVVTIVIIWSGFTYARAGGDPNTTAEAKNRIKNAIIALAVYIFLGAMMNWAIPGGLF